MRKRSIIACIITAVVLYFANNLWLEYKPVDLAFNLSGNGVDSVSAKLSGLFSKSVKAYKKVDLAKDEKIQLKFSGVKNFRKLKITIDSSIAGGGNLLMLTNTEFREGKYKLNNLEKFRAKGAKLSVKNGTLIIYPSENKVILTYPIYGKAASRFQFELFVIILTLSYLLSYKLVDYIADFKTLKNQSRVEILFLTVFFALLLLPMSCINKERVSIKENRVLATWQPFITEDGDINYNFGNDFDSWYNDRFFLRNLFIDINYYTSTALREFPTDNKLTYLNRKNNWISQNTCWTADETCMLPSEDALLKYHKGYLNFKNYCDKSNAKFYVISIPAKETIYNDFQDSKFYVNNKPEVASYVIKYLEKHNINVLYPFELYKSYKGEDMLYYKTDHHYTDYASSLVASELFKYMQKDFNNLVEYKDFKYTKEKYPHKTWNDKPINGSLFDKLRLKGMDILDTDYKFFKLNKSIKVTRDVSNVTIRYENPDAVNSQKVYIVGDSFIHSFARCLTHSFKEVVLRRDNYGKHVVLDSDIYSDIRTEKPDIVIWMHASPHFMKALNLFVTEENK